MNTVLDHDSVNSGRGEKECLLVKKGWLRPELFLLESTIEGALGAGSDLGCVPLDQFS